MVSGYLVLTALQLSINHNRDIHYQDVPMVKVLSIFFVFFFVQTYVHMYGQSRENQKI